MNYRRPNLWKATFDDIRTFPPAPPDTVPISEADALRLATQLRRVEISVRGNMFVDLVTGFMQRYTGVLDLATDIDTSTGEGIYGASDGFAPYFESYFYAETATAAIGAPATAVPWVPRPDPADRVKCDAFTSMRVVDFNFPLPDAGNRSSRMAMELIWVAGQWYLKYTLEFVVWPPTGVLHPPFYLCTPFNPGIYDLRASGTWNFLGYTFQWEARSPLSSGVPPVNDVWGPALDCGIIATPIFW
jgi:hypothetical protein